MQIRNKRQLEEYSYIYNYPKAGKQENSATVHHQDLFALHLVRFVQDYESWSLEDGS